ncbi:MAG: type II toxin-antitoxin system RelE/ParE family toxin [Emcibacter sp.]|nr:type II toxin-antitoxin system RelE/ParE family toxin [Emcibacter sp.]
MNSRRSTVLSVEKYKIRIKPTAENDLIIRYQEITDDSPENALKWYLNIIEIIEKLDVMAERHPLASEDIDINRGIRHFNIDRYRILYFINENVVEV